jgi:hypothetical protein
MMITDLTSPNTESNRFNSSPVIPKGRLPIKIFTRSISPEIELLTVLLLFSSGGIFGSEQVSVAF